VDPAILPTVTDLATQPAGANPGGRFRLPGQGKAGESLGTPTRAGGRRGAGHGSTTSNGPRRPGAPAGCAGYV